MRRIIIPILFFGFLFTHAYSQTMAERVNCLLAGTGLEQLAKDESFVRSCEVLQNMSESDPNTIKIDSLCTLTPEKRMLEIFILRAQSAYDPKIVGENVSRSEASAKLDVIMQDAKVKLTKEDYKLYKKMNRMISLLLLMMDK